MMHLVPQAVVDRLKAVMVPTYEVDHFPDAPDRYPFAAQSQTLLVAYERSTYGDPLSAAPMHVMRDGEVTVTLVLRSLRGPTGVVETIQAVTRALFGWRVAQRVETPAEDPEDPPVVTWVPLGSEPMVPTGDAFVGEKDGVWRWAVTFRVRTPVVEDLPALTGPALKSVTVVRAEGGCQ
jgi:hypothetical protein